MYNKKSLHQYLLYKGLMQGICRMMKNLPRMSDYFLLFFAVVPSSSSLVLKKEESASSSCCVAILLSLCVSISLTLFLRQGANPNRRSQAL